LAVASLLLGIGTLLCFCLPVGIPAVICGHKARSRIRKSGKTLTGAGLALGGLITGYIGIALLAIAGVVAAVAIPHFAEVKQGSRNDACIGNLKAIQGAKTAWAIEHKKQPGDTPTDADLFGPDKYMREKPTCPEGGIYKFNSVAEKPSCSIPSHRY
jgi:hypothetical protein